MLFHKGMSFIRTVAASLLIFGTVSTTILCPLTAVASDVTSSGTQSAEYDSSEVSAQTIDSTIALSQKARTATGSAEEVTTGPAEEVSSGSSIKAAKVKITAVKNIKISLSVRWSVSKNGKYDGFVIYRKKGVSGKWEKLTTITNKHKRRYLDRHVTYGHTYFYKIKSYYNKNGSKKYSSFSDSKKCRVAIFSSKKLITSKKSGFYNQYIISYKYGNGDKVRASIAYKYVKPPKPEYELYVNKARQTVTVCLKIDGGLLPVKCFICSPGAATETGTYYTKAKFRWHELMGPCWGQFDTRIYDGVYFHSIFSSKENDNKTMSVSAYNKLGTTCSHGCVRLQAGSAKWIYDNCELKTKVVIYNGSGYEPFKKPVIAKLPAWHTWDPTDPTAAEYCKEHGCHQNK